MDDIIVITKEFRAEVIKTGQEILANKEKQQEFIKAYEKAQRCVNFLMGQVMRKTKGVYPPDMVRDAIINELWGKEDYTA